MQALHPNFEANNPDLLTKELLEALQFLGDPQGNALEWSNYLNSIPTWSIEKKQAILNDLRPDVFALMSLLAAKNKNETQFAEAFLYQVEHDIISEHGIQICQAHTYVKSVYQNTELLFHRIPELFHGTTVIHILLKLNQNLNKAMLDTLAVNYVFFKKPEVCKAILEPTQEELLLVESLINGETIENIIKNLYRSNTSTVAA
jgi:hypothetical protein